MAVLLAGLFWAWQRGSAHTQPVPEWGIGLDLPAGYRATYQPNGSSSQLLVESGGRVLLRLQPLGGIPKGLDSLLAAPRAERVLDHALTLNGYYARFASPNADEFFLYVVDLPGHPLLAEPAYYDPPHSEELLRICRSIRSLDTTASLSQR
jgi:hypothetical protein